jgi:hypothetical protein
MEVEMTQAIQDLGRYSYGCADGSKLELRRMSEREQERFSKGPALWLLDCLNDFAEVQNHTRLLALLEDLRAIVKQVGIDEAYRLVRGFDDPQFWADIPKLALRILQAEGIVATAEESQLPTPEKVEQLGEMEVERLGEGLALSSSQLSTSPCDSPAATCSAGSGSTTV